MIPATFITLDALPLTPSGKLDRRALPAPGRDPATAGYAPPRTPAEKAIAAIWADVLGIARVGIHDNFFELGGDSILSIQIVSRARRAGLPLHRQGHLPAPDHRRTRPAAPPPPQPPRPQRPGRSAGRGAADPDPALVLRHVSHGAAAAASPCRCCWSCAGRSRRAGRCSAAVDAVRGSTTTRCGCGSPAPDGQWRQDDPPRPRPAGLPAGRPRPVRRGRRRQRQAAMERRGRPGTRRPRPRPPGRCSRAVLFDRGARTARALLFLTVHHLVVDGVSWRILLDDLDDRLPAGSRPGPRHRPGAEPERRSGDWAPQLDRATSAPAGSTTTWPTGRAAPAASGELPAGRPDRQRGLAPRLAPSVTVRLSREQTDALLHQVPGGLPHPDQRRPAHRAGPGAVRVDRPRQRADRPGGPRPRGRRSPASTCPAPSAGSPPSSPSRCTCPPGPGWGEALKSVKEQLRAVPRRGLELRRPALPQRRRHARRSAARRPAPADQLQLLTASGTRHPERRPHPTLPPRARGRRPDPRRRPHPPAGRHGPGRQAASWSSPGPTPPSIYDEATVGTLAERHDPGAGRDRRALRRPGRGRPHPVGLPAGPPRPGQPWTGSSATAGAWRTSTR